jgi:hypothetical protein
VPGVHADLCDLVGGHLASFGLPWWRRAGRQANVGVALTGPPCHLRRLVRPFVRSSVSLGTAVVKVQRSPHFPGFPRCGSVGRCSTLSTSFVLAALRALQVDSVCAPTGMAAIEESLGLVRPSGPGHSRPGRGPRRRRSCWRGAPVHSRSLHLSCRGPAAAARNVSRPDRYATSRSRGRSAPAAGARCLPG